MNPGTLRKILAFSAVVEIATGFALMIDPALVASLLLGAAVSDSGTILGRCFGIALLALGISCWPFPQRDGIGGPAFRAMLIYNAGIALYLFYVVAFLRMEGLLSWPAIALHAIVATSLAWSARAARRGPP